MFRIILLPIIIVLSGLAPLYQWSESRYRQWCGWLDSAMNEHWIRLFKERTGHAARNILTEWTRLDPQRASKLFSFLLMLSIIGNIWLLLVL